MYVSRAKEVEAAGFFFANRSMHWFLLGTSFLTGCMFNLYVFGLMASQPEVMWIFIYGLISAVMLVVLAWLLVPLYLRMGISTLPEYFEKRFSRNCRFFLSTLYVFCNLFIRLIVVLVAGGILINRIAGVDPFSPLLFFLFVTGIYVIIGGLRAEVYAGVIQTSFIVVVVAGVAAWVASQNGGVSSLFPGIASLPRFGAGVGSRSSLAGIALGLPIIGFWFWCADQSVIQKVVSVRSVYSVRRAAVFSSLMQIVPIVSIVVVSATLYPRMFGERTLNTLFAENSMPEILRVGLVVAVAAALMAQFAGLFNSTSLLVTFDFFRSFKPSASERTLLLVGRMTTIVILLYSILLMPVSQTLDFTLCLKLFKAFIYFAALITGVFVVSLVNRKIGSVSALLTLHVGAAIILVRVAAEIFFYDQGFEGSLLNWFTRSDPLEFTVFVFLLSVILMFAFHKLEVVRHAIVSLGRTLGSPFRKFKVKRSLHKTVLYRR